MGHAPVTNFWLVWSDSWALAPTCLISLPIWHRYECALHLGNSVFYPDFTILHPKTQTIYCYEHFGMMDDPKYAQNAFSKMQTYNSYGIIPSINFIATFETKEHPLDAQAVNQVIENYFLN